MNTTENNKNLDLEELLNTERFQQIASLYAWSTNYEFPSPFSLFLDLIGYSEQEFGDRLTAEKMPTLGLLECAYLGDALSEYSDAGEDAFEFVSDLLETEANK